MERETEERQSLRSDRDKIRKEEREYLKCPKEFRRIQ